MLVQLKLHRLTTLLPLVAPLLTGGCFERVQATTESLVRPVQAVRVALAPASVQRGYAGVIRPRYEADIAFRASGRMIARQADVGQTVAAGQVLAVLDPTDLVLAVRSAEADLASARAQAAQAQSDAKRSTVLTREGWNAAATDEAKQAAAQAAVERVTSAQAALDLARNRQNYAVLRAPAAGVITAALADPGTVVAEGQAVLRFSEAGPPEAEVALPENAVAEVRTAAASVTLWARPTARLAAKLRELSPTAEPGLRTYRARFALADAPDWVAQGMTATVHLDAQSGPSVATLPLAALADRGNGPMVWVVRAGSDRVEARPVKVVALEKNRAEVTGLADGELVIGLGVQKLDPAALVRVADIRPAAE